MGQTLNIADKVTRAAMPVCITRRLTRPTEAAMHVYRGLFSSLFRLKLVYKKILFLDLFYKKKSNFDPFSLLQPACMGWVGGDYGYWININIPICILTH